MNQKSPDPENQDVLTADDFRMISEALAGILHKDIYTETQQNANSNKESVVVVVQGASEFATDIFEQHANRPTSVIARSNQNPEPRLSRRSALLLASSLALGLAAVWVLLVPPKTQTKSAQRTGVAYSLASSRTRGDGDKWSDQTGEWVLRVEQSNPAIGYVIRSTDDSVSLERGQLELPNQDRYILRFRDDRSQYFLLLLDPDGRIDRNELENLLISLNSKDRNWKEALFDVINKTGASWFSLTEIEKPSSKP